MQRKSLGILGLGVENRRVRHLVCICARLVSAIFPKDLEKGGTLVGN